MRPGPAIAPSLVPVYTAVRDRSRFIDEDRPIGREIEAIASELVGSGRLIEAAGLATSDSES